MYKRARLLSMVLDLTAALAASISTQHPIMPPGMTHEEHLATIQEDAQPRARGEAAMGFDQDTTSAGHSTRAANSVTILSAARSDSLTRGHVTVPSIARPAEAASRDLRQT
jgi:hypothetical protein